jgi:hypothetical protein
MIFKWLNNTRFHVKRAEEAGKSQGKKVGRRRASFRRSTEDDNKDCFDSHNRNYINEN